MSCEFEPIEDLALGTVVTLDTVTYNVGPDAARLNAQDFFKCYLDFKRRRKFSIVPYFLCARAIELSIKSVLLESSLYKDRPPRRRFGRRGHDLAFLYAKLPEDRIQLSKEELDLLFEVNKLYSYKDFEYCNTAEHMMQGYKTFPDLRLCAALARKMTGYTE